MTSSRPKTLAELLVWNSRQRSATSSFADRFLDDTPTQAACTSSAAIAAARVALNSASPLVPDTEAELVPGVTTTTTQCAAFSVGLPLFQILAGPGNGNLYLFAKVDDATQVPTFAQSCITWQE